ncbi:hypothetical protein [Streptomyces albidus (ex Kaewkla and Franco 2022)]|uniref:hypothetical protein n=1 Tax=Streptomyces albidus (ex Kaewkla and Franco 2022) TaxID=722709 RepID=UPI0015EF8570|nr:hypothetical protein [Streptomyces albidus (ex Kaewkla and Franco 2022)]
MRTSARMAGAVAAIAATALLVSGCGSSEDKGGKSDDGAGKPKSSAPADDEGAGKPDASTPADDGGDGGGKPAEGKPVKLAGFWKAKGKQFVLTIAGDAVTLLREETNCTGRVMDAGEKSLVLKCPNGTGEDRTNGTVGELKAKSMKVTWNGGATDVYTKVADAPAKLPKDPKDVEKLEPQN